MATTDINVTFDAIPDLTPEAYLALRGEKGDTGDTGADGADGQNGVGITSITQNEDGTLTITLDDGSAYDTEPLKGEDGQDGVDGRDGTDGNGIESAVLNSDYTLTLTFTDGTSYTTPSIRGVQGEQGIQGIQGIQGDTGDSGVYIGTTTPTDPDVNVWVDPSDTTLSIPAPSSPSNGDFLVYNGTAWVAQSLSTWQGGNY